MCKIFHTSIFLSCYIHTKFWSGDEAICISVHYMYVCLCFVLQANIDLFSAVQFTVIDVSLAAILTPTATNLLTPTATPTTLDLGVIIGIVIASIILLIVSLTVLVIVCCFLWHWKIRYCVTNHRCLLLHSYPVLSSSFISLAFTCSIN